jgi:hypothetical protein
VDDLVRLIRKTPNRGRTHIFLGHPLSDGCDKTTVEPGNNFSPGVWTCGISVWIENAGRYYTPDLAPETEIGWTFSGEHGCPPVVESRYPAGPGLTVANRLGHLGGPGAEGTDFCEVAVSSATKTPVGIYLVVRDAGPAGGKIKSLEWEPFVNTLVVNGSLRITVEQPVAECRIVPADAEHDSPVALIRFAAVVRPDEPFFLGFRAEHGFDERTFTAVIPKRRPYAGTKAADGLARCAEEWKTALPARVFAPDPRIARTWERCAFHILSAMECGLPRIGAVNYPVFWMRDGVIVLKALDLIGRPDLAWTGCDYLTPLVFSGGFGAEADAPGEGLLTLASHGLLVRDREWLAGIVPYMKERVKWIRRMRGAKEPLRALTENRMPGYVNSPGGNIVCLPAENGLIHGKMDWHTPDFYINCWTAGGLRRAAEAMDFAGESVLAREWRKDADELDGLIAKHLLPGYGNERDPAAAPYPTGALPAMRDALAGKFAEWYRRNRLNSDGSRKPERLWSYFEAAQIHNAILLGMKEEAWVCLDGMLSPAGSWDVSAYTEGDPGGNEFLPFRNGFERRGWLDPGTAVAGNMPHNWTTAEMIALIRTVFVVEEEGTLVLGKGVPPAWFEPGSRFGVRDLPTDLGKVSYMVTVGGDGKPVLDYSGPRPYRLVIPTVAGG